jgi:hypothetical protein
MKRNLAMILEAQSLVDCELSLRLHLRLYSERSLTLTLNECMEVQSELLSTVIAVFL